MGDIMKIYNKEQIKIIEKTAKLSGIPEIKMMENAGIAASKIICEKFEVKNKSVVIVAGNGNNGGDGFVVAKKLFENGAIVSVVLCAGMPSSEQAKDMLSKLSPLPIRIYSPQDFEWELAIKNADLIIDAIYGIGFHGEVNQIISSIIKNVNSSNGKVIALDLPSGCECDSGVVANSFINADLTISFIAVKPCHILYPASDYCGKLINVGIGLPSEIVNQAESNITIIDNSVFNNIPKYNKNAHKGSNGSLSLLCGSYGMAGAAILSIKSAARCGVGLTKAILEESIYSIVSQQCVESVYHPYKTIDAYKITECINNSSAAVLGCGLGVSTDKQKLVEHILINSNVPMVLDADGINNISGNIDVLVKCKSSVVLTPHPKEMSRLLGVSVGEVQENRLKFSELFAKKTGEVLVLKGANTIVALPDGEVYVCMRGNPGMATAGSGDVLSGIIGSLLAQGLSAENAAILGVQIHAIAGDKAAMEKSMHGMIASDIIDNLPSLFKEFE